MVDRSNKVDVFRGLLFALMVNSHALTLAHVPPSHWFWTDWWLPKGWATVVFVILSGYGVGLVYTQRAVASRAPRLQRRCLQLLGVMAASNTVFAMLREASAGNFEVVSTMNWWLGFLTFETKWTISGVLLPTAMVMLCGAAIIRWTLKSPWTVLAALAVARLAVTALTLQLAPTPHAQDWLVRFLLFKGFGGYPVVPFVINGCIGIWLGVMRRQREPAWKAAMAALLLLQLAFYLSFCLLPGALLTQGLKTLSPLGKFACVFIVTHQFERFGPRALVEAVEMVGRFALGSFVMHRVFIQLLAYAMAAYALAVGGFEQRYVVLVAGTLFLTWGLCHLRQRIELVNAPFRRLAL
ncbi:acyltransferase family protein [Massilia horti]|uniref:Acyltransferase 3 domain-containing protein n=1 Tax=Massilia horti TaxID=2562153 RepID=A0A4Y9SZK8_9BURK|nr:acyltransferase family protein [Massilia horti]TFW30674.1 hypothetical protein E4O92_16035 [Massilia horti]